MKKLFFCCMTVSALLCAVLISVSADPDALFADQAADEITPQNISEKGSALYENYCAMCHGPEGNGYLADEANALSNPDFLKSASDDYIIQGILRGRPGTAMSAWGKDKGGILSDEDAEAILAFIRTWQTEPPVKLNNAPLKGDSENGIQEFERWCAACHGKYGEGGKAAQLKNQVFLETASDAFIRYTIENGRRNTQMSAYKNILSAGDIDDVISYLRTLNSVSMFQETSADDIEELSKVIAEKGVLNPKSPPADFNLIENRFVAADDIYAAYTAGQSFIIIDARPGSDYLRSHITGAISIPFYDIKSAAGLLPKDRWIITYCACPHALSGKAADTLKAAGYDKVAILNEGFFYWTDQGYPSESSINSQLKNE
jgi:cytochrome c oxidase cbb3-type subunit 3/ubiquinol-cytochrome c reductase cytochrome c subunit